MSKIKISKNPQANWENDAIQFPRFIAELEAAGAFEDNQILKTLSDTMDLDHEELLSIIDRAQKAWDDIKAQLANPLNPKPKSNE